jgi:hypothetical protein
VAGGDDTTRPSRQAPPPPEKKFRTNFFIDLDVRIKKKIIQIQHSNVCLDSYGQNFVTKQVAPKICKKKIQIRFCPKNDAENGSQNRL